jgi:hypothetical protein
MVSFVKYEVTVYLMILKKVCDSPTYLP